MYEHFTDRARNVLRLANQEAQRFNYEYVGTEHLLLGLVKEGSGVAANVLKSFDVDLGKVRRAVESVVQPGPPVTNPLGKLPMTPRAKKVIDYAWAEAALLRHDYLGTEHLLLGLLREGGGVGGRMLWINFGLSLDAVRKEVLSLVGNGAEAVSAPVAELIVDRSRERYLVRVRYTAVSGKTDQTFGPFATRLNAERLVYALSGHCLTHESVQDINILVMIVTGKWTIRDDGKEYSVWYRQTEEEDAPSEAAAEVVQAASESNEQLAS